MAYRNRVTELWHQGANASGMIAFERPDRRIALCLIATALSAPSLRLPAAIAAESTDPSSATLDDVLPFRPAGLPHGGRRVFAHWHVFPISIDNRPATEDYYTREWLTADPATGGRTPYGAFLRERPLPRQPRPSADWVIEDMAQDIRWAAAIGIDAFLFNIISVDPTSLYWRYFQHMLKAAAQLDGVFKIVPNLDTAILRNQPVDPIATAIASVSREPGLLRLPSGEVILGAFMAESWPADKWQALFDALNSHGILISFLPTFLNTRDAKPEHFALAAAVSEWSGNFVEGVVNLDTVSSHVRALGKQWCAPVWPQDSRPKDGVYGEAANSRLFRDGWMSAIRNHADFAQLITWNDYSEASELRPSTGIQYSFYDLAAYYIAWFKSGQPPEIIRDVLYYFHRVQSVSSSAVGTHQRAPMALRWGRTPVNEVELVAFLTAPGVLEIELGGRIEQQAAVAGTTTMRIPLAMGRPSFRLKRNGKIVIDFASAFPINEIGEFQDLLYRGGSSTRAPIAGNDAK